MIVSKFTQNIYFILQTLQTIYIQSLNIFSIKIWHKIFFLLLFSHWFNRGERSLESNNKKKKSVFLPIPTTKIVDLGVKGFYFVRGFYLCVLWP